MAAVPAELPWLPEPQDLHVKMHAVHSSIQAVALSYEPALALLQLWQVLLHRQAFLGYAARLLCLCQQLIREQLYVGCTTLCCCTHTASSVCVVFQMLSMLLHAGIMTSSEDVAGTIACAPGCSRSFWLACAVWGCSSGPPCSFHPLTCHQPESSMYMWPTLQIARAAWAQFKAGASFRLGTYLQVLLCKVYSGHCPFSMGCSTCVSVSQLA